VVLARLREYGAGAVADDYALAVNSDHPRIVAIDEVFGARDN